MSLSVGISGIGVLGPGLAGWPQAIPVLRGDAPFTPGPVTPPAPTLLPATERRRTGASVRIALAVAAEAVQDSLLPPEELDTVFACANGEGKVIASILEALHTTDGAISPTEFHNSVHNAAAGYWGIAVGSSRPSVSLGGHDGAFATGLLHAATQVVALRRHVLFVAHDVAMPAPLDALRPSEGMFAVAFVLAPNGGGRARITLGIADGAAPPPSLPADLARLSEANPAARSLPMLASIARGAASDVRLPMLDDSHLLVTVAP